jgi:hypothetical protein
MLRKLIELGSPVRINRPVRFKISSKPSEKLRTSAILGYLDCIVNANKPRSPFGLLVDPIQMGQRGVSTSAVGIDHDRIGFIESRIICGPTIAKHLYFHRGNGLFDRIG